MAIFDQSGQGWDPRSGGAQFNGGQMAYPGGPGGPQGFGPVPQGGGAGASPGGAPGQFGPALWQQFGGVPFIDPNNQQGWVNQYAQMLAQSQQPYLQQAQAGSDASYASRGLLYGGGAASASDNLQAQYMASIAGGTAPLVQQAMGNQQQDTMFNAGMYGDVVGRNMDAYNNQQNSLFNAYMGTYGAPSAGQGIYQGATGALGSTYGDVYGSSQQGQNAFWGSLFGAAGQYGAAAAGG